MVCEKCSQVDQMGAVVSYKLFQWGSEEEKTQGAAQAREMTPCREKLTNMTCLFVCLSVRLYRSVAVF